MNKKKMNLADLVKSRRTISKEKFLLENSLKTGNPKHLVHLKRTTKQEMMDFLTPAMVNVKSLCKALVNSCRLLQNYVDEGAKEETDFFGNKKTGWASAQNYTYLTIVIEFLDSENANVCVNGLWFEFNKFLFYRQQTGKLLKIETQLIAHLDNLRGPLEGGIETHWKYCRDYSKFSHLTNKQIPKNVFLKFDIGRIYLSYGYPFSNFTYFNGIGFVLKRGVAIERINLFTECDPNNINIPISSSLDPVIKEIADISTINLPTTCGCNTNSFTKCENCAKKELKEQKFNSYFPGKGRTNREPPVFIRQK